MINHEHENIVRVIPGENMSNLLTIAGGKRLSSAKRPTNAERSDRSLQRVSEALDSSVPVIFGQIKNRLIASSLLPENTEVTIKQYAGVAVRIDCSWLPKNTPAQPRWSSKLIKILIHGDLVDHFYRATPDISDRLIDAIVQVVRRRLTIMGACLLAPGSEEPFGHEIHVGPQDIEWSDRST